MLKPVTVLGLSSGRIGKLLGWNRHCIDTSRFTQQRKSDFAQLGTEYTSDQMYEYVYIYKVVRLKSKSKHPGT